MTESSSISTVNRSDPGHSGSVLLAYSPGQGKYSPLRASEVGDVGLAEIHETLQDVADGYHRHREVGSHLTNRAHQLPTHL